MASDPRSLVEQVRTSGNRQLKLLAAGGFLPLPAGDLIPLQVELAQEGDEEIADRARGALAAIEPKVFVPVLAETADPRTLAWCAATLDHPKILEAIVRRRDTPREVLRALARKASPDLQEIVVLRQDAIVEDPGILDALAANPDLSNYAARRVAEYREHLLPRERKREEPKGLVEEATETELARDLAAVREVPAAGEFDEQTGLSEAQIRLLPVSSRLRLTRGAGRSLRNLLLRDPVAQVAVACLQNNQLPESEVESVAKSRSVCEEVLAEIGKRREWVGRYPVAKALAQNPKTPITVSIRMLPRLGVRDLRDISRDRNVPDAVRAGSLRLYRIKTQ